MKYTDEQTERANRRNIIEYFQSLGYKTERMGRDIKIHGFGGLCVNPETNKFYIHSRQTGGYGLIDCLMKTHDMRFPDAVREALGGEAPQHGYYTADRKFPGGESNITPLPEVRKREFVQPAEAENYRKVYAYLTKRRCISPDIINRLVHAKLLYQDSKGGCVFLHRNGDNTPCGAEIHGTGSKMFTVGNTSFAEIENRAVIKTSPVIAAMLHEQFAESDKSFAGYVYPTEANIITSEMNKQFFSDAINNITPDERFNDIVQQKYRSQQYIAPGTSNTYFQYDCGTPQKAYVFESAIDMMSFMQLHPEADNCKFVSMAGLKPSAVNDLLEKGLKVVLCVDNDTAALNFCRQFAGKATYFGECRQKGVKDYNELLCKQIKKKEFQSTVNNMTAWADTVHARAVQMQHRQEKEKICR